MKADWTLGNLAAMFEGDYEQWLRSLGKARRSEPRMTWNDLGPHAHLAYEMHVNMALEVRTKKPATLPEYATPEGFYLRVCDQRTLQVAPDLRELSIPTPWVRLSSFSRWIYTLLASRIAREAGFKTHSPKYVGDGLDYADDDDVAGGKLGDGLDFDDDDSHVGNFVGDGLDFEEDTIDLAEGL